VIYIDSSVILAQLFSEDRQPRETLWQELLVSSRLLEYEVWNRALARSDPPPRKEIEAALRKVEMTEMSPAALRRALSPFPVAVRTLHALHLATAEYLRRQGESVELASYDNRLLAGARAIQIPIAAL
jgi:predicted nucleic acid-binding protein